VRCVLLQRFALPLLLLMLHFPLSCCLSCCLSVAAADYSIASGGGGGDGDAAATQTKYNHIPQPLFTTD